MATVRYFRGDGVPKPDITRYLDGDVYVDKQTGATYYYLGNQWKNATGTHGGGANVILKTWEGSD